MAGEANANRAGTCTPGVAISTRSACAHMRRVGLSAETADASRQLVGARHHPVGAPRAAVGISRAAVATHLRLPGSDDRRPNDAARAIEWRKSCANLAENSAVQRAKFDVQPK